MGIGLAVAVVCLLVIIVVAVRRPGPLDGFWVAKQSFLEKTGGLTAQTFFFKHVGGPRYKIYVLMAHGDQVLVNDMLDGELASGTLRFSAESVDADGKLAGVVPRELHVKRELGDNRLVLEDGEGTAWAVLYKDHELSESDTKK